jgi:hypothetical protein
MNIIILIQSYLQMGRMEANCHVDDVVEELTTLHQSERSFVSVFPAPGVLQPQQ